MTVSQWARLTLVPLTLHWKLGSGTPSASQIRTLLLASPARCLFRLVITGLPLANKGKGIFTPQGVVCVYSVLKHFIQLTSSYRVSLAKPAYISKLENYICMITLRNT